MAAPPDRSSVVSDRFVPALRLEDLPPGQMRNAHPDGRHRVLVRAGDGTIHAFDARCPHMGYPLMQGHLEPGVLRCDWHHWRFDLGTGGCLTFGGVDLPAYPVRVEGEWILVGSTPSAPTVSSDVALAGRLLEQGLRDGALFPVAKATASLLGQGSAPDEVAARAARYAAGRTRGFASAFTILACVGRSLNLLDGDERSLALVHAFHHLADAVRDRPERPLHPPLASLGDRPQAVARLRRLVDEREAAGAERILRSALESGDDALAAEMVVSAATDHVFLSTGHVLDETRQALRLVRWLGAEPALAGHLLAGVLADAMDGQRHEEDIDWQEGLGALERLDRELAARPIAADGRPVPLAVVDAMLQADLADIFPLVEAQRTDGAGVRDLSRALLWAAVERQGRFPLQNLEDWNDVHHLFTYANAVDALAVRYGETSDAMRHALTRAVYHGFGYVALTRYLNRPRGRYPWETGRLPRADAEAFASALRSHDVVEGGRQAAALALAAPAARDLERILWQAVLHEDAGFHLYQSVDAALRAQERFPETADARARVMFGSVRFVLSQRSQQRVYASTRNALRLLRGESLETGEEGEDGSAS